MTFSWKAYAQLGIRDFKLYNGIPWQLNTGHAGYGEKLTGGAAAIGIQEWGDFLLNVCKHLSVVYLRDS
ncbi:hypothetical protein [Chitinophaga eiseniae]|uniref:Uncharacterized protein n=1 Tax=Chitinophaga eiseniae TaxID=634771 RepID=A0A847SGN4_9BACT|nr:hypothetical protein [Chitinophaga eiseniae]NLR82420.1 hypothetical protein [Chitinophaga eiseniae]